MPGIAEFLGESPYKLIIAELPDGHLMLTMAQAAGNTLRFAARSVR